MIYAANEGDPHFDPYAIYLAVKFNGVFAAGVEKVWEGADKVQRSLYCSASDTYKEQQAEGKVEVIKTIEWYQAKGLPIPGDAISVEAQQYEDIPEHLWVTV